MQVFNERDYTIWARANALRAPADAQREADFEAENPPFPLAMAFALDHAAKKRAGADVYFHWSRLARDLHQRYGSALGRSLYDAGLSGYPPPGRAGVHDEHWTAIARRLDEWDDCDESLVTRMRAFRERPLSAAHRWFKDHAAYAARHPEWPRNDTISAMEADVETRHPHDAMVAYAQWVDACDAKDQCNAEMDDFFETVNARAAAISEEVQRRAQWGTEL